MMVLPWWKEEGYHSLTAVKVIYLVKMENRCFVRKREVHKQSPPLALQIKGNQNL